MNIEETGESRWEDYGSWERRASLCGDSIYKRLEAIRLAVLERCTVCKEFEGMLKSPFAGLYSITESMQLISGKLERMLPHFVAVDDGKIRRLNLQMPGDFKKSWENIPLREPFSADFERGKIKLEDGVLSLEIKMEGDLLSPEDIHIIVWADCYSAEELKTQFPVFLPHSANLTLTGDWMFGIHQLLKKLTVPQQELYISFHLTEYSASMRSLWLESCPSENEWYLNGTYGTGSLSEAEAWERTEDSESVGCYAEIRRLKTDHSGFTENQLFGWGVPYVTYDVSASQWTRTVQNDSSRIIAARTGNALPVNVIYECRHDAVGDFPFLSGGDYAEGEWQILAEQKIDQNETILLASAPIQRPSGGNGARTDRYRKCTISLQCPFDYCGLEFL